MGLLCGCGGRRWGQESPLKSKVKCGISETAQQLVEVASHKQCSNNWYYFLHVFYVLEYYHNTKHEICARSFEGC